VRFDPACRHATDAFVRRALADACALRLPARDARKAAVMNHRWPLQIASATHTGMVRAQNEDALHADPSRGYAILADGMGGYNAGEIASQIAVTTIVGGIEQTRIASNDMFDDTAARRFVEQQVCCANTAIYEAAQGEAQYSGMGTTLVIALWYADRMVVGHVGDSRLYRLRNERMEQVTRDHSVLQEQIDSGLISREAARYAPHKNLVTRALGIDDRVQVETGSYAVEPDDIYLLCSDGLSDMVEQEDMQSTLCLLRSNLSLAAKHLVQQANDNGGRDNVSIILVGVGEGGRESRDNMPTQAG
jgi:PPM family protein phosphatase